MRLLLPGAPAGRLLRPKKLARLGSGSPNPLSLPSISAMQLGPGLALACPCIEAAGNGSWRYLLVVEDRACFRRLVKSRCGVWRSPKFECKIPRPATTAADSKQPWLQSGRLCAPPSTQPATKACELHLANGCGATGYLQKLISRPEAGLYEFVKHLLDESCIGQVLLGMQLLCAVGSQSSRGLLW